MKTKYVSTKRYNELNLEDFPNAGPNSNITGMKKIYGKNAYLLKCGKYLYNVDVATYEKA